MNKSLRLCYYFSGQPPTYSGEDEYKDPVSNCFCRNHARDIHEGMKRDRREEVLSKGEQRDDDDGQESDNSNDTNDKMLEVTNHKIKKRKRIIHEESDSEST